MGTKYYCSERILIILLHGEQASNEYILEPMIFSAPVILESIIKKSKIEKWPNQKKLLLQKISFFMRVNHTKEFLKFIHTETLFLQLFARNSTSFH